MAVEIMRKETGLADSLGYVFFVRTAELFSMVASALVIASNVWTCVLLFPAVQSVADGMDIALRLFNIAFGVLVILAHLNLQFMARYFYFMMTFAGTGMFQIFVGVLLLAAQNASSYAMLTSEVNTDTETVDAVRIIAGWTLLGSGALFCVMVGGYEGLFRFPHLARRRALERSSLNSLIASSGSMLTAV